MGPLLASLRFAVRDLWVSGRRSAFFALLVAAGVASLVGMQGFADSVAQETRAGARQLMQGDLRIDPGRTLTEAQRETLASLERDGAQVTTVWQTIRMASVPASDTQLMVEVKAVDPGRWPFYGGFQASSDRSLADLLGPGRKAVVGEDLLDRLALKVGDSFTLGTESFEISAVIQKEPRNIHDQFPVGPRVLVSSAAVTESLGGGEIQTILIRLPQTMTLNEAKERLGQAFDTGQPVQTYEEAWQSFSNVMDMVFAFLNVVALISLLVGGLGVAMAMRTFVAMKLEQIAVLKSLGVPSGRLMTIFLLEAVLLGSAGSVIGALLGLGVQVIMPYFLQDFVPTTGTGLNLQAAGSGLVAGILTAALCAYLPIRLVQQVKPVALFRSDAGASRPSWGARFRTLAVTLGVLTLLGWMVTWYARSAVAGFGFLGALLGVSLVLFVLMSVALWVVRLLPQAGRPALRHAIRSLRAPGNQATAVGVSLGLGILLVSLIYLLQAGLVQQIREAGVNPDMPNLYVFGVAPEKRSDMRKFLESHSDVSAVPAPTAVVTATVVAIDGKKADDLNLLPSVRTFSLITVAPELPKGEKVTAGEWFSEQDFGKPYLTLNQKAAADLGNVGPGTTIVLRLGSQDVPFTVKSVRSESGNAIGMSLAQIGAAPGSLDRHAETFLLSAVTKPDKERQVVQSILSTFPGVTPLGITDMMNVVDGYLQKIASVLRFLTSFVILAAGVILSGSLSVTQLRRRRETALLKVLGANRLTVVTSSTAENGLLGALAGLAGGGLSYVIVSVAAAALQTELAVSPWSVFAAVIGGGVLAILVGLASTHDVLQVRPLSVLKSE